jgi:Aspartyl protease
MFKLKGFGCIAIAITAAATVNAESHCPGNVASVPYHLVNRHQMIVDVSVNHAGPYSFLLDTGAQMTMIDPSLAASLRLAEHGEAGVASAGMNASASFSALERIEASQHKVTNLKVLVYDLGNLQASGLKIQGVLGEDFLERFDMLIDNAHRQLCLDDTGAMRTEVKGSHIPLLSPTPAADGASPKSLIVSVRLSGGMRPVRLKLDSGANVSFLYEPSEYMALGAFRGVSLQGGANRSTRNFTALPLQDVKIGGVELFKVPFVMLMGAQKDSRTSDFDGLLSIGLFKRVFINHADHFAVLDPM